MALTEAIQDTITASGIRYFTVPDEAASACEYKAFCKGTATKAVKFPWGYLPCCDKCVRFMEKH